MLRGDRIKALRVPLGISQERLGQRIGKPGTYISAVERGIRTNITTDTLEEICTVLGCSADYLLGHTDDPKPQSRRRATAHTVG